MKKLMNEPIAFVDEMLEGLLLAYPDQLKSAGGTNRALVRADAPVAGRVGIVAGGGSGHLPVFLATWVRGLASGVAIGNVFSSPTVEQIAAATRGVDSGKGVLYLYGNYSGDVMNFDSAAEEVEADGIRIETVLVADDVASAPPERSANRRGVAGLFYAYKVAGAKAEAGGTLEEVKDAALKAVANCRTMGVGLTPSVYRPWVNQRSRWRTTRWRSGSGSTANRGSAEENSYRPTKLPRTLWNGWLRTSNCRVGSKCRC